MQEILIFSEVPIVRAGLKHIFGEQTKFKVIDTCHSKEEALQAAEKLQPEIFLCNLAPDVDLGVVYEIRQAAPYSSVVLFTRELPTSAARQALDMGVRGIVSTTARAETLLECLNLVAAGQTWLEGSLAAEILTMQRVSLSPRQKDLLRLLVRGFKNKEIAWELVLSVGTVKAYLTTLFEKVGAKDRFELALFGLKYFRHFNDNTISNNKSLASNSATEEKAFASRSAA